MPERRARAMVASRRLAARVREAQACDGPVQDLDGVMHAYAQVHETSLPAGYCALVVHGDHRHRPNVHIDPNHTGGPLRRRAALAHALGHIVLGWHIGMCGCEQADGSLAELPGADGTDVGVWASQEAEADAFARELLVPRPWLRSMLRPDDPVRTVRDVRAACHIPAAMAAAAVSDELPAGHVWAVAVRNHVRRAGVSPGTAHQPPERGAAVDRAGLVRNAREHHTLTLEDRVLHWWVLEGTQARQAAAARVAAGTATDLLDAILTDMTLRAGESREVAAQVTSIAGWAVGERPAGTTEELVGLAQSRISSGGNDARDIHVADAMHHPLFGDYITARAIQLAARRSGA